MLKAQTSFRASIITTAPTKRTREYRIEEFAGLSRPKLVN
jgi:hypothetical protein